jgi:hypothetical protein
MLKSILENITQNKISISHSPNILRRRIIFVALRKEISFQTRTHIIEANFFEGFPISHTVMLSRFPRGCMVEIIRHPFFNFL